MQPAPNDPAAKSPQLAHIVFFTLSESTAENRRKLVDLCSTQINGLKIVKNARTGADTRRAVPSGWPSATCFGTSSPITTCR